MQCIFEWEWRAVAGHAPRPQIILKSKRHLINYFTPVMKMISLGLRTVAVAPGATRPRRSRSLRMTITSVAVPDDYGCASSQNEFQIFLSYL